MAYIGNKIPANFQSLPAVQRFNGDGSDTTFTLSAQIANDQSILVSVDGVTQDSNAYAVSGTTLTFTAAPSSGTGNIFVNTISPVGSTVVPPDGLAITATTGTFSGDLTVDTSTLKVDSSNNKVGIGLTSPQELLHLKDGDIAVGNGTASNNAVIGKIGFSTDSSNSRFIGIESFRGSDAANADLRFHTYGGDGDKGERMRIANNGNVGIGNATPSSYDAGARQLVIGDYSSDANTGVTISGSTNNHIYFADGTSGDAAYRGSIAYNHASDHMLFRTAGFNERMRIDSGGRLLLNTTTAGGVGYSLYPQTNGALIVQNQNYGNGFTHNLFQYNGTTAGAIVGNTSSTAYNTSSDYRLKENVDYTWDATTRLKQLKPARFNFIVDETNTLVDGFLAHEVSSIVPEAITGAKDAMTTEVLYVEGDELPEGVSIGDVKEASVPDYQGIDQSKLVPLLVKAMQEQQATIEALITRITALEA